MSSPVVLKQGQKVGPGRFTLLKELGRGGMGVVWLAHDTHLDEPVALKFLLPEIAADPVALNDLRKETVRSHRLTHPNIVRIHDFHQPPEGLSFISMEYVEGQTLSGWRLQQPGQVLSWEQLAPLVAQLCAALEYAHGEGVIHRDLKPANVMLDSRGRVKLADFGIAAVMTDSMSRMSQRSSTGGTLAYMSPQQLAGKMPSVADDVYALGATIYELLTGKPPFFTGDLTHQILNVPATPVSDRALELGVDNPVPPDVGALLMACLAKQPEQRPASSAAVAAWVGLVAQPAAPAEQFLAAQSGQQPSAASPQPTLAGNERGAPPAGVTWLGRPWLWGGTVAMCFLLAALCWLVPTKKSGGHLPADRWTNSLGMVFVPVPGTDVQFSIWETRVQDFAEFARATGFKPSQGMLGLVNGKYAWRKDANWRNLGFTQSPSHPAVGISWDEAREFCLWLTQRERKAGHLNEGHIYRLPTDVEWSRVVGLRDEPGRTPAERSAQKVPGEYYWGRQWPPPPGTGNFAGEEVGSSEEWLQGRSGIRGYHDGFTRTAPVGSFAPNPFGIYDLEGNIHEWCKDSFDESGSTRVLRGAFWASQDPGWSKPRGDVGDDQWFSPANRRHVKPDFHADGVGFRVVLAGTLTNAIASDSPWITLFDGRSTDAWRGYNRQTFPTEGWTVEDGALKTFALSNTPDLNAPDLISKEQFKDFVLEFEWRVSAKGDSGVYYSVADESKPLAAGGGVEMQVVDDDHRLTMSPDCVAGAAALLLAPSENRILRPVGEFNRSRIVIEKGRVQHWLNGVNILEFVWGGQPMREACARLKAMNHVHSPRLDEYGGHIALQHAYAGTVWFRNIRARRL